MASIISLQVIGSPFSARTLAAAFRQLNWPFWPLVSGCFPFAFAFAFVLVLLLSLMIHLQFDGAAIFRPGPMWASTEELPRAAMPHQGNSGSFAGNYGKRP